MILKSYETKDDHILLHYETVWPNCWMDCLDLMQVFYNDLKVLHRAEYLPRIGAKTQKISSIPNGLLYDSPSLREEGSGIYLAGISKTLNTPIALTVYNQLPTVGVEVVFAGENSLKEDFEQDKHKIDKYLGGVELNARGRDYMRFALGLMNGYMQTTEHFTRRFRDLSGDEQECVKWFAIRCERIGVNKDLRDDIFSIPSKDMEDIENAVQKEIHESRIFEAQLCLTNALNVPDEKIDEFAEMICENEEVYFNFQDFMETGEYNSSGVKIMGFNAYDLTQPPISLSPLSAIIGLCDICKNGSDANTYKLCYTATIDASQNPERTKKVLDLERKIYQERMGQAPRE